jgi:single-strand DNA-binding protein
MAGSFNQVLLIGNLGKDPEVRSTQDSTKIVNLTLATSETWNDRASGERKERTDWHKVVIFNERIADVAERFLKKGAKVLVMGQLQTRKWTNQQGQDQYSTEVVLNKFGGQLTMLEPANRSSSDGAGHGGNGGGRQSRTQSGGSTGGAGWDAPRGVHDDLNDPIPF